MYFKSVALVSTVSVFLAGALSANEVEWKYFTASSWAERIQNGDTGFLVCANEQWDETASEKEQSIFRRNTRLEFPAVPTSGDDAFNCVASGNDVVAANWSLAEELGDTEKVFAAANSVGFKEVTLPE